VHRGVIGLIALPGHLTVKQHQELSGRSHHVWARRAVLALLAALAALGLANFFFKAAGVDGNPTSKVKNFVSRDIP
jgi:hypothetical protein